MSKSAQHDRGPATVLARRDCPQMQDAARRIARHFGLSGLIGLDFIRDRQGQVHLLEINPRATPTAHLVLGVGHDPCGALLQKLGAAFAPRPADHPFPPDRPVPPGMAARPRQPLAARAFHDVPWDDPAVLQALIAGGRSRNYRRRMALNDDLAGEFANCWPRPKDDWTAGVNHSSVSPTVIFAPRRGLCIRGESARREGT